MRFPAIILSLVMAHASLAFDLTHAKTIDLTHDFSSSTVYWPTSKSFTLIPTFHGHTDNGYYYSSNDYSASEHGGTHMDAPIHFAEHGQTLDQIPLSQLIGPLVMINVQRQSKDNRDYLIQIADFEAWEKEHGKIPEGAIVLLNTGFHRDWTDAKKYLGTVKKGTEGVKELSFPGLAGPAATWLVEQRKIHAVGIDTASIDYGKSTDYQAHQALAKHNIPILENVANLDALEGKQATIIALPMKIKDGSGGPTRIMAVLAN